ncbi:MAG: hypothetical protein Q8Q49_02040 [bacterium]|nr:hypothetical protein [bacterium]
MSNGESPVFDISCVFPADLRVGQATKDFVSALPESEQQQIIAEMRRGRELLTQAQIPDILYEFYRGQLFLAFPNVLIAHIDPTPSHRIFAFDGENGKDEVSTLSHIDLFWQTRGQEGQGRASVAVINASQIGVFVDNRHADDFDGDRSSRSYGANYCCRRRHSYTNTVSSSSGKHTFGAGVD